MGAAARASGRARHRLCRSQRMDRRAADATRLSSGDRPQRRRPVLRVRSPASRPHPRRGDRRGDRRARGWRSAAVRPIAVRDRTVREARVTKGVGGSSAAAELAALAPWADQAPSITCDERDGRIEQARRLMHNTGADALLIGAGASLRYFAGVTWGASERLVAMLLPRDGTPILIAPAF